MEYVLKIANNAKKIKNVLNVEMSIILSAQKKKKK